MDAQDQPPSTPSPRRGRPLKNGHQARVKCDTCRRRGVRCSPERDTPTDLECDTCKKSGRVCNGYTALTRRTKTPKKATPLANVRRPSTPEHAESWVLESSQTQRRGYHSRESTTTPTRRHQRPGLEAIPLDPSLLESPSRLTPILPRVDPIDYGDLVEATELFVVLGTELATQTRQYQRLNDLFGPSSGASLPEALMIAVRDLAVSLAGELHLKAGAAPPRSAERLLLDQVHPLVQLPEGSSTYDQVREVNFPERMMKLGFLGSDFMRLTFEIYQSGQDLSSDNLLALPWLEFVSRIPLIQTKFKVGVDISDLVAKERLWLPAFLMCGKWGCDYDSESFVNFSFLWNWMRTDVQRLLRSPAALLSIADEESAMAAFRDQGWDLEVQDRFGHTFHHAAVLADPWGGRVRVLISDGSPLKVSAGGKTVLHYAAAVGTGLDASFL